MNNKLYVSFLICFCIMMVFFILVVLESLQVIEIDADVLKPLMADTLGLVLASIIFGILAYCEAEKGEL